MTDSGYPYDLIIFDLDGTLVDTFPWFLRNLNQVAAKFRFRGVQDHEVEALRHFSARQLIAHLKVPAWKLPIQKAPLARMPRLSVSISNRSCSTNP